MSPKKKVSESVVTEQEPKEEVKEVLQTEEPKSEVKESPVVPAPSFVDIELTPPLRINPLTIYDANPNYAYRWCRKDMMAGNRKDIWHSVDKSHPDFKGLRVAIDHSRDHTYFSYGDLILCCCRKETAKSKRKLLDERAVVRTKNFEGQVKETTARMFREGKNLSKRTQEEMEAILA